MNEHTDKHGRKWVQYDDDENAWYSKESRDSVILWHNAWRLINLCGDKNEGYPTAARAMDEARDR